MGRQEAPCIRTTYQKKTKEAVLCEKENSIGSNRACLQQQPTRSRGKEARRSWNSREVDEKFEVEVEEDSTEKQLASADCREVDNGLNVDGMEICHVMKDNINEEAKEELPKGDAGNQKRQKVDKLNKLLENLLTKMKWETIIKEKVEKELKSRCEEKLFENEKEGPSIKVDEKDGMETSWRDKDQNIGTLGEMGEGDLLDDRHLEKLTHTEEKEHTKATVIESRMVEIR